MWYGARSGSVVVERKSQAVLRNVHATSAITVAILLRHFTAPTVLLSLFSVVILSLASHSCLMLPLTYVVVLIASCNMFSEKML
jgi:hypothetical protein